MQSLRDGEHKPLHTSKGQHPRRLTSGSTTKAHSHPLRLISYPTSCSMLHNVTPCLSSFMVRVPYGVSKGFPPPTVAGTRSRSLRNVWRGGRCQEKKGEGKKLGKREGTTCLSRLNPSTRWTHPVVAAFPGSPPIPLPQGRVCPQGKQRNACLLGWGGGDTSFPKRRRRHFSLLLEGNLWNPPPKRPRGR